MFGRVCWNNFSLMCTWQIAKVFFLIGFSCQHVKSFYIPFTSSTCHLGLLYAHISTCRWVQQDILKNASVSLPHHAHGDDTKRNPSIRLLHFTYNIITLGLQRNKSVNGVSKSSLRKNVENRLDEKLTKVSPGQRRSVEWPTWPSSCPPFVSPLFHPVHVKM